MTASTTSCLTTTIIESGLDIPTANTLIVHRADMFGLAQLYQLRGRVGRAKQRAYALLTTPPEPRAHGRRRQAPEGAAIARFARARASPWRVMISIFAAPETSLANSNPVTSGKSVSSSISKCSRRRWRASDPERRRLETADAWSPQINIGTSVLIPEQYVPDLQVRLGLYRRLADIRQAEDIDAFAAELHDRFGELPAEGRHLLDVVAIKLLCRDANVASLDAGPKGAVLTFRAGTFPNPTSLVEWITLQGTLAKLRPDMKLVIRRSWDTAEQRLRGARQLMTDLQKLANAA